MAEAPGDTPRQAGILLHPSSLPSGNLGEDARRFVDFLASAGISVWQMLPIGPVDESGSPYQSLSLHAGRRDFISRKDLIEAGWLDDDAGDDWLVRAARGFRQHASADFHQAFDTFKLRNRYWLDDYALFLAIRERHGMQAWWQWPADLRTREPAALDSFAHVEADLLEICRFEQFLFFLQWHRLLSHAHANGIALYGDMAVYPAHDSVDVWANQDEFLLDRDGQPLYVAGVPPDAFSATGQHWGNPVYDWQRVWDNGFRWWLDRLRTILSLFDQVRIDHFRGLAASWHIPAASPTAETGAWHQVPGHELLTAVKRDFPGLPLVAEDLGLITPDVEELRDAFGLPGMRVIQFAFDSDGKNPHLPHNHVVNCISFTGTHDNNTISGWLEELEPDIKERVMTYLASPSEAMPWPIIRANLASVAKLAITPMQDFLSLGEQARMNRPGTTSGNWHWRFDWQDIPPDLAARIAGMLEMYNRKAPVAVKSTS